MTQGYDDPIMQHYYATACENGDGDEFVATFPPENYPVDADGMIVFPGDVSTPVGE